MSVDFLLPDVGEGIHEAEIRRWLVSEGEIVQEFDPIVEVQTDKAVVELPAPVSGRIAQICVDVGSVARVGDVLVTLDEGVGQGTQTPGVERVTRRPAAAARPPVATVAAATQALSGEGAASTAKPLATPGVRHYARQHGIALRELRGTGPAGRIERSDIDNAIAARMGTEASGGAADRQAPAAVADARPPASTRVPFRGLRRATAEHVVRSAFSAPHVTAFDDCEATALVALRNRWNEVLAAEERRVSYLPFLVKVVVSALRAYPYFNARLHEDAEEIELFPEYHIGIAVDTPEGLVVPVVRNADRLSLLETADEIARLTKGARNRTLTQQELRGSTFTITNMGPIGGMFATPLINFPEVAILAVHTIVRKPVVREEQIVIRDMLTLSLSFDHRVIDGAASVRFMNHVKRLVENPELLMLELK